MKSLLPAFALLIGVAFVALGVHEWHPHTTGITGYYDDLEDQMFAVYLGMVGIAIVAATVASLAARGPGSPRIRLPRAVARRRG